MSLLITSTPRRGRTVAALTAASSLVLASAALTVTTTPSQGAPGDCAVPADLSLLEPGDPVTSLTVSTGTTPDTLEGEVLGILDDGIAPGLDMVMVDFSGNPEIDLPTGPGGIWQGMSGSPVYDAEGDIIGAVAYGMAWGPSPIAGITPFEEMDDYFEAPAPTRIPLGKAMARQVEDRSVLTRRQAQQGLRQLQMPLGVSGLSAERLAASADVDRPYAHANAYVGSGVSQQAAGPETLVDGGNIGASLSYGDITQAGVGTVTDVCGDQIVGFGHPMIYSGRTTMSLHPASAVYIQEDPAGAPFKLANLGSPAGVIDDDRLGGISGIIGEPPAASEMTSTVTYGERSRTGSSAYTVGDYAASTVYYQVLANHDRVVDAVQKGSEVQSWTIEGTDADGEPFTLSSADRYLSTYDISGDVPYELADTVYVLSLIPGVVIDRVDVTGDVTDSVGRYRIGSIEQYRDGRWRPVSGKQPASIRAGGLLRLRAVLENTAGEDRRVPFQFAVPKKLRGKKGQVFAIGGEDFFGSSIYELNPDSATLDEVEEILAGQVRNDEIQVAMVFGGSKQQRVAKSQVLAPADQVVGGFKRLKVVVRK